MKVELTILGLLNNENLYGYDIKKKILEASGGFVDTKFGSIYYAIKKSLNNGWIKRKGSEKDGGNPERYIYQITPEGKKYLKKGIRQYFDQNLLHFDIDIMLLFLQTLDKDQKNQFVEDRIEHLADRLAEIKGKITGMKTSDNNLLFSYIENHLKSELAWIKSIKP